MSIVAQLSFCFAAGCLLQRSPSREALLRACWFVSFCVLGPLTAFYAFSALPLSHRTALLAAVVAATMWSALAIGYAYGSLAGRDLAERATLALPIAFWNTGYVGYVIARILWGQHGFALMVFFDQVGFLVPAIVVSTAIARSHGGSQAAANGAGREFARRLFLNPPLAGAVAGIGLKLAGVPVAGIGALGHWLGVAVGPFGFLLLGLSLPLAGNALAAGELRRGVLALVVRYTAGPALLAAWSLGLGVHVPPVFYLAALTPAAAHLLVLSRLFALRPALMRLVVVGSTALTLGGVALAASLQTV